MRPFLPFALFLTLAFCGTAYADISLDDCRQSISVLTAGMTRLEIEKKGFTYDGGVSGILKNTRMIANNMPMSNMGHIKLCMIYIDFRPKDISDLDYTDADRFAAWVTSHKPNTAPTDIAVKIGEPFLDFYHFD